MSTPTNIDTTQAMLVGLSFTLPRQSVQLSQEARDVEAGAKAATGTVKASLFYFQKADGAKIVDALADLKSYQNAWRSQHNRLTRVWDGNNIRLLPAALIVEYMEMTAKNEAGLPKFVDAFLDDYRQWSESAPERMGSLYPKANFPSASEVMKAIGHSLAYLPLPAAEQFKRIATISPDLAKTMAETTDEKVKAAVAEAQAQTWRDVMEPIKHVVDTLGKEKPKIYESLIGNVLSICDLVPAFNLEKDPNLAALAEKAKAALSEVSAEDLRKSDEKRQEALKAAKELVAEFEPFARQFAL